MPYLFVERETKEETSKDIEHEFSKTAKVVRHNKFPGAGMALTCRLATASSAGTAVSGQKGTEKTMA